MWIIFRQMGINILPTIIQMVLNMTLISLEFLLLDWELPQKYSTAGVDSPSIALALFGVFSMCLHVGPLWYHLLDGLFST